MFCWTSPYVYNAPGVPREIATKVLHVFQTKGHQFVAFHVRDKHFAEEFLFMNRDPKFALDQDYRIETLIQIR